MSSTVGSSDLKKFGKRSLNFEDLLDKKEVLDIFFILFCAIFSITIIYQLQFLQSSDAALSDLGLMALGLGFLSFIGAVMGLLLSNAGFIEFKNLKKNYGKKLISLGELIKQDEEFVSDYTGTFLWALVLQVGFSAIYGGFYAQSAFNFNFDWQLNSLILVVNAGIGEELFFSLFLSAFTLSLCSEKWHVGIAGLLNIFVFVVIHTVVYGGNPEAAVYIVFLRGLYFLVYFKTRRPSIIIILHVLNNFLFVKSILFI